MSDLGPHRPITAVERLALREVIQSALSLPRAGVGVVVVVYQLNDDGRASVQFQGLSLTEDGICVALAAALERAMQGPPNTKGSLAKDRTQD